MATFKFVTDWRFSAPVSEIWDEITSVRNTVRQPPATYR